MRLKFTLVGDDGPRGPWIRTYTGGQFFPFDPRLEEINIHDIAHALSLQCRYTGHCSRHYSVAEHSLHVADAAPPDLRLEALLHDASEAYLVDVPRPIKRSAEFSTYRRIEKSVQGVIYKKYGITNEPSAVKDADRKMLAIEAHHLMSVRPGEGWDRWFEDIYAADLTKYQFILTRRSPEEVESLYRAEVTREVRRRHRLGLAA
jgi:uncharacterized protein